jgi:hypothetical protein
VFLIHTYTDLSLSTICTWNPTTSALDALHMMMVDVSMEGVLLLFPAWPPHAASFNSLRLAGALVVSASWGPITDRLGSSLGRPRWGSSLGSNGYGVVSNGYGVVSPVRLVSLAGRRVLIMSPWHRAQGDAGSFEVPTQTMAVYELPGRAPLKLEPVGAAGSGVWAFATSADVEYSIERTQ